MHPILAFAFPMSRFKLNMPARGGYYAADHKKHGQKGTGGWRTMDKTRRNKMIASYLSDWVLTIFLWSVALSFLSYDKSADADGDLVFVESQGNLLSA